MRTFSVDLIKVCRLLSAFERDLVCCGRSVTVPQCWVLQILLDGPQTISNLAEHVGGTVSAMTRLIDGLERKGKVSRTKSSNDKRRVVVELTADGRDKALALRGESERLIQTLLYYIPPEQHQQVKESIKLIRTAMESINTNVDFNDCCETCKHHKLAPFGEPTS